MPYTYATFEELKNGLAARLDDRKKIFYVDREIGLYLQEAFRTFGLLTGFWRERAVFETTPGVASYDIGEEAPGLVDRKVTDMDLIELIQYHLLESHAAEESQSTWFGTEMFTLADLADSIERRRNQFLADTGVILSRDVVDIFSPRIGRQHLADDIIDVRRVVWIGAPPFDYYKHLRREDEVALAHYNTEWSISPEMPYAWSVMAPPPLELQLAPPPLASGQLDLVTVKAGPALDPDRGRATTLGIPDDCAWVVKWGALADLLSKDGVCRDPVRAQFAEEAYGRGVLLTRLLPVILTTEINGVQLTPVTLDELDSAVPDWQNFPGPPTDVAIQGSNLIWLYPTPDDIYSVTVDVVRKAMVPIRDDDEIQLGREQIEPIIDYAEHLALFKVSGTEWHATNPNASNFITQSITMNRRLAASARYLINAKERSIKEKFSRPRRMVADGVGTLPSTEQEQGVPRAGY